MSLNKERLRYLLQAYLDRRITMEEMAELRNYVEGPEGYADLDTLVSELWDEADRDKAAVSIRSESMYEAIWNDARLQSEAQKAEKAPVRYMTTLWRLSAGLAAMLFIGLGLFMYLSKGDEKGKALTSAKPKTADAIVPGGQKAMLTLADGRTITLDQSKNGILAREAGMQIVQTEDGQIFYELVGDARTSQASASHTIRTPRGGEYRVVLPDGTKVWLNAESSLHYPSRFGSDKRVVELVGEAYFEVSKHGTPFFVKSSAQTIKVLGTHFNVHAYKNVATKTTLLEGSIQISSNGRSQSVLRLLRPNQESTISGDDFRIASVDASRSVAWKNGYFAFYDENITQVMSVLARWYDIEVAYEGDVSDKIFGGTISRFENIETLLKTIELTGSVRFRIEGRKVIVIT